MATLEQLQARLEALLEARSSDVREAKFGEDAVVYKNDSELAAAIADLEFRIAKLSKRPVSTVYIQSSKGLTS